MSFSFLFLVTASRMRSCACDTASRLCVRTVLCSSAFLLVPPLPSTSSAAAMCRFVRRLLRYYRASLTSPAPFIIGDGLRPSRCGPGERPRRAVTEISRFPRRRLYCACRGSKDDAGWRGSRDDGPAPVAFCLPRRHRHPGLHCFRRSIPGLHTPLSTLRVTASRPPAHDSGPVWIATPSP